VVSSILFHNLKNASAGVMVKKLLLLVTLLPFFVFAQNRSLDAYKYIYVKPLYQTRVDNAYDISVSIANAFISKGFILANRFNQENIPPDLKANPCLLLTATPIYDDGPVRGIKLKLDVRDCNNKNVFSEEVSATAVFLIHEAFTKAIRKMTARIEELSHVFNPNLALVFDNDAYAGYTLKNSGLTLDSVKNYLDKNNNDAIEGIYKSYRSANDHSPSCKFAIVKKSSGLYHAIMIESETTIWKPGEIKMIIENTAMSNLFSIQYYMEDKTKFETFGSLSRNIMKIDFGNVKNDSKSSLVSYIKTYPFNSMEASAPEIPSEGARTLVGTGSGFLITGSGLLVTNNHVIDGKSQFTATNTFTGKIYELETVWKDKINDLAILRIKKTDTSFGVLPYSLSIRGKNGQSVFTIGYPLSDLMGENQKISNGIINSLSGISDDSRYYQISVPIQPGNSGGPLFDMKGNVIGITTSGLGGSEVQNVNYAIKMNLLQNLVGLIAESDQVEFENTESNVEFSLTLLSERYKAYVFKISCYK
jgi:S1-C subfamily serine protease